MKLDLVSFADDYSGFTPVGVDAFRAEWVFGLAPAHVQLRTTGMVGLRLTWTEDEAKQFVANMQACLDGMQRRREEQLKEFS